MSTTQPEDGFHSREMEWLSKTLDMRCPSGKPPNLVYKFMSTESTYFPLTIHEAIVNNRFWLSGRGSFNDPFDSRFAIDFPDSPDAIPSYLQRLGRKYEVVDQLNAAAEAARTDPVAARKRVASSIDSTVDRFGIYSLTERIDHPLMWAHYACCHKGIAMMFNHGIYELGAYPVRYQDAFPRVEFNDEGVPIYAVLAKGQDWAYEFEWRIVRADSANTYMQLDPRELCGVVLGAKATKETESLIMELLSQRRDAGLPDLRLLRAEAGEQSFDLEFKRRMPSGEWMSIEPPESPTHIT